MENGRIDVNEYVDALPTFKTRPENLARELKEMLQTDVMKAALAIVEENILWKEKMFMKLNFASSDHIAQAMQLQGAINALRSIPEIFINIANGDEK